MTALLSLESLLVVLAAALTASVLIAARRRQRNAASSDAGEPLLEAGPDRVELETKENDEPSGPTSEWTGAVPSLTAGRTALDRLLLDQPLLCALFDENADLLVDDRVMGVRLEAYARMHLDLFQLVFHEVSRSGASASGIARAWTRYVTGTYARSSRIRQVLREDEAHYDDRLVTWLRTSEPRDADEAVRSGVGK